MKHDREDEETDSVEIKKNGKRNKTSEECIVYNRSKRKKIMKETLSIIKDGKYINLVGKEVILNKQQMREEALRSTYSSLIQVILFQSRHCLRGIS